MKKLVVALTPVTAGISAASAQFCGTRNNGLYRND
jgi:hypothetical protein